MVFDIFRSKRLLFLPMENTPEHDDFLYRLRTSLTFPNAAPVLPLPGGHENSKKDVRDYNIENGRLAVYICIPPDSDAEVPRLAPDAPVAVPSSNSQSGGASADELKPKPKVIGILVLSKPGPAEALWHHSRGTIGIQLLEEATGKGYGGEAIEWLLWYGFVMIGLHRIEIGCAGFNFGARRLYERLGFTVEGVAREHMWYMGGWHDEIHLGILDREWKERQRERGMTEFEGLGSRKVAEMMGCS